MKKNLCSTDPQIVGHNEGNSYQNLSRFIHATCLHAASLSITDRWTTTSLCAMCLCLMMCCLGEVERGISFHHLSGVKNCICFIVFANTLRDLPVLGNKSMLFFVWASKIKILKFSCGFNCPIKFKQKYKAYLLNNPPSCSSPHAC